MELNSIITHRFVNNEDLNHHGTLFAGRTAEWFVEAGLMAAANYVPAKNIVCVKIHGMDFKKSVLLGATVRFASKIVYAGKSSLIAYIRMSTGEDEILSGFITFVNTDDSGKAVPHNVVLEINNSEDIALHEMARHLSQ